METLDRIRVIDFETTGFPPGAKIVEVGWCDVTKYPEGWRIDRPATNSMLVNPGMPIPPEVSAIHGITDDMVAHACAPQEAHEHVFADGFGYFCAHNTQFDRQFAPARATRWLCTLAASRRFIPGLPSYKNEEIRKHFSLCPDDAGEAHRAGWDAFVTANILQLLLERQSLVDLAACYESSRMLTRMPFGKHAGKAFEQIPEDYLRWLSKNCSDKKVCSKAVHEINRRAAL